MSPNPNPNNPNPNPSPNRDQVGRAGLDQLLARGFDELDMFACKQCDGVTRARPAYHLYPD